MLGLPVVERKGDFDKRERGLVPFTGLEWPERSDEMGDKWLGNNKEICSLQDSIDKAYWGQTVVHTALKTPVEISGARLNFRWCIIENGDGYLVVDGRDAQKTEEINR
jgi:hypothetical protein